MDAWMPMMRIRWWVWVCLVRVLLLAAGITQYFGDVEGDLKNCQVDLPSSPPV